MFNYIIVIINNKTLFYKFIIAKISYKFLLNSLFDYIIHEFVFYQNLLLFLLFIVDVFQIFSINLFYLIATQYKNFIQLITTTCCPIY